MERPTTAFRKNLALDVPQRHFYGLAFITGQCLFGGATSGSLGNGRPRPVGIQKVGEFLGA